MSKGLKLLTQVIVNPPIVTTIAQFLRKLRSGRQMDSIDALSRSRCNERLLNRMLENMKLSDNVV